jgi:hypothetical protein
MPTISIFFGIVVQMYWNDHSPPHVHAYYGGFEALFGIEDANVIGGRLPPKVEKLVRSWVIERRLELMENWQRGRNKQPFQQIPGADV